MVDQGILGENIQGFSNWASSIVARIHSHNGELRICGDYEMAMNHQNTYDSILLPNIETSCDEITGMKYLSKHIIRSTLIACFAKL